MDDTERAAHDEPSVDAAMRELEEETGYRPAGDPFSPGEARQPGGKLVQVWPLEGDWDVAALKSNTFEMTWPPRSQPIKVFPELDHAAWFAADLAKRKILKGKAVFIERLLEACDHAAA